MQFYELSSLFTIKDGKVTEADLLPLLAPISDDDLIDASAGINTTDDAESWVDDGVALIGRDIAMNLLKNVSPTLLGASAYPISFPAKPDTGWCVLSLDKGEKDCSLTFFSAESTHQIPSLRAFFQKIDDGDYISALLGQTNQVMNRDADTGPLDLEILLSFDLADFTVGGTWFDGDDDWGYTPWAVFFNSWGYSSSNYRAWCLRMDDFEGQLLNWSKTSLNDLLDFINAKV